MKLSRLHTVAAHRLLARSTHCVTANPLAMVCGISHAAHRRMHRHVTFCRFLLSHIKTGRRKRFMGDGLSEWLAWNGFDQSGNLFDAAFFFCGYPIAQSSHIDICDSRHAIYTETSHNSFPIHATPSERMHSMQKKEMVIFYMAASKRRIKYSGHTFWMYDTLGGL